MSKHIAIATLGTRGDVQPYIALAIALKKRGHSVVLGAPSNFEDMVRSYGVEFHSLGTNIQSFLNQSRFDKAISENKLTNMPGLLAQGQEIIDTAARCTWEIIQDADAIILNINTSFGIDMAEALGIVPIMAPLQPLDTTSEFPFVNYTGPNLGPAFNRLSYVTTSVLQAYYDFPRNRLRRELMGLKRRKKGGFFRDTEGRHLTTIYAFSPHVVPRPRDWPRTSFVTGFWRLPDNTDWKPSEAFKAFLAAGDKPVYVGFGSMSFGAERNTEILSGAAAAWGGRVVVSRGWGGINPDNLPANVFSIGRAPHDKLFEHVAGVVHHGGAGTTSAGLYAGCPTFIVPQAVDQPFWARRIHELGCGPAPVSIRKLTASNLANAMHEMTTRKDYRRNAEALAVELRQEDGTGKAVESIERVISHHRRRPASRHIRNARGRIRHLS